LKGILIPFDYLKSPFFSLKNGILRILLKTFAEK